MIHQIEMSRFSLPLLDELTKIAADVEELRAGYRRAIKGGRTVRVPVDVQALHKAAPTATSLADISRTQKARNLGVVAISGGGAATIPRPGEVKSLRAAAVRDLGIPSKAVRAHQKEMAGTFRRHGGMAVAAKGGASGMLRSMGVPIPVPRGRASKAIDVTMGLHEGFEQRVPKARIVPGSGHVNPAEVLSQEHNLIRRMTGRGADKPAVQQAQKFMTNMRQTTGEAGKFRSLVEQGFGERAGAIFGRYGSSRKIPKAMRKRLSSMLASGKIRWR